MENLKDDVIHATNINNVHFTTDHRTEYFNRVYENEVWAFPDPLEKRIPGGGVRSGSGSTVSKTENVRFIDNVLEDFNIRGVIDVPCGDLNWMVHVKHFSDLDYFGGDVSSVMIDEHELAFASSHSHHFGLVDIVDVNLTEYAGVRRVLEKSEGVFIIVRQLMQHLATWECIKVLENLVALKRQTPDKKIYVGLTTYLRQNGNNQQSYLLATGHKINLFRKPFCLPDPIELINDGAKDIYFGFWELTEESMLHEDCD